MLFVEAAQNSTQEMKIHSIEEQLYLAIYAVYLVVVYLYIGTTPFRTLQFQVYVVK